jgi:Na+/proline symporter
LTLPDFYTKRFNGTIGALVAVLCVTSFIVLTAGNLAGVGIILQAFLGWSPAVSISAVAAVVTLYTIVGGLYALTWNDILQIGVACVAFVVAAVWGFCELAPGSFPLSNVSLDPIVSLDRGVLRFWASLLALALGDVIALDFMERVFAARSAKAAQLSCLVAGTVTICMGVLLALLGTALRGLVPDGHEMSLLDVISLHFPPSIKMLFVAGLIGAGISTIDGSVMACSVALSRNVLQYALPKIVSQSRLLMVARVTAVPIALLATVLAIAFPIPGELLVLAFDVVFAGCFVPLALGIFWRRGTPRAALWAVVVPSVLRVILHVVIQDMNIDPRLQGLETLVPPLLSLVLFVGISLLDRTPAAATERAQ